MDLRELEQIIRIMKENDVSEFELDDNGVRIKLSRGKKVINHAPLQVGEVENTTASSSQPYFIPAGMGEFAVEEKEGKLPEHFITVEAPIVGTFYRKPSPDAESFVAEGQMVKRGQTLCIIEAMKIMNEIESPCTGRVEKIFLADGSIAEFGEKLFWIDTSA